MYNIFIHISYLVLHLTSILFKSHKKWRIEQTNLFNKLHHQTKQTIWFHCASFGEYQQIKPLITHYNKLGEEIIITFFSSSGYDNFDEHSLITQISYLPIDIMSKMDKFIQTIKPKFVFIANNEVWPNMIKCLNTKQIPLFLIGYKFNKKPPLFVKYFYLKELAKFNHIFSQDRETYNYLNTYNIKNILLGNLRINQIIIDSKKQINDKKLKHIAQKYKVVIYGSVELTDCSIIENSINSLNDVKHIIVPHNYNDPKIYSELTKRITKTQLLYSQINSENFNDFDVLLIDVFGLLKYIYQLSSIVYIGGGFGSGIHNILEPAVFNNYILFGPNHSKFPETSYIIKEKIGNHIVNGIELKHNIETILHTKNKKINNSAFFKKHSVDLNVIFSVISKIY